MKNIFTSNHNSLEISSVLDYNSRRKTKFRVHWIGHIIRRERLLEVIVEGKNNRGSLRLEYIEQIIKY